VAGLRVFIAGDTALFSDMERIGRPVQGRGLDVAVLPIGDLFTMGPDDAVEAVRLLKPKLALPSHYGTWPPIEQDAIAWARRVEAAGLAAAKAPAVGEPITIG
jgi:L-ascorbate metabolism protein UlaG (beta-lactamase superfamily)